MYTPVRITKTQAGHAEGLDALQGLLALAEGWRHAMDAHIRVRDKLEGCPFIGGFGVNGFDVAVDCEKGLVLIDYFIYASNVAHVRPATLSGWSSRSY